MFEAAMTSSAHSLASVYTPESASAPQRVGVSADIEEANPQCEEEASEALAMRQMSERMLSLNEIGLALSSERDIESLLALILSKARDITNADAASLYILEAAPRRGGASLSTAGASSASSTPGAPILYFRLSQNESIKLPPQAQRFPVSTSSLAGYVAHTGQPLRCEDAYSLPEDAPYTFNDRWDRENGYRTRSVLVVPMTNRQNQTIGVLQLINRKARPLPLRTPEDFEHLVLPFDDEAQQVAAVVASHAAVALETNGLLSQVTALLQDSEAAFDSFVQAAAQLIDDRDPPTAGHSQRVTRLTLALATAAESETTGPFANVYLSERQKQELRYAGLLHDVGKIGVADIIFAKSHRIEAGRFEAILHRVALYRAALVAQSQRDILHAWKTLDREAAAREEARLEQVLAADLQQLDADRAVLPHANDPSAGWLSDEAFAAQQAAIARLSNLSIVEEDGSEQVLVEPEEAVALSVRRGSLTDAERRAMEDHAQMSFEVLEKIAWPPHLKDVPAIAYCHHEKMNGTGYPRGLKGDAIPLLARMMTVADIFDALTAADRPYKKAMPVERALKILHEEVEHGNLDGDVVALFERHRVWEEDSGKS
jgi:HD-GYP domain-containing protein (c-di-GMP phosphodiesterase class II)